MFKWNKLKSCLRPNFFYLICFRQLEGRWVKKNLGGFTLLEVIVTVFVILTGIIGALISIQQILFSTKIASSQLIASYLCQEGVEIVRNIRDGNWLNGRNWTNGIFCCPTPTSGCNCEADYTATTSLSSFNGTPPPLRIDGGFYNYRSGTSTPFTRIITVASTTDPAGIPIIDTRVVVRWKIGEREYQASTTSYLYNWR